MKLIERVHMEPHERVLIVDDDVELCELVAEYLGPEGFKVEAVHTGNGGVRAVLSGDYALAILDIMLPGINGLEVLRRIRAGSTPGSATPVLMLTARGDDVDRIVGLELGADDYLPKPFNPRELAARIRAILRRTHAESGAEEATPRERLRVGDVEADAAARIVQRSGERIELTALEFDLLLMLLRSAGKVVSRDAIAREVFDRKFLPYDRSIDMHISNLRKKLGHYAEGSERVKTVRGSGYIYVPPPETP